jgi:hypothetical protein
MALHASGAVMTGGKGKSKIKMMKDGMLCTNKQRTAHETQAERDSLHQDKVPPPGGGYCMEVQQEHNPSVRKKDARAHLDTLHFHFQI